MIPRDAAVNAVARRLALWLASWTVALWPRAEWLHVSARRILRDEAQRHLDERQARFEEQNAVAAEPAVVELDPRTRDGAQQVIRRVVPAATVIKFIGCGCHGQDVEHVLDIEVYEGPHARGVASDEWAALLAAGVPLMPFAAVERMRAGMQMTFCMHAMAHAIGDSRSERPTRGAA